MDMKDVVEKEYSKKVPPHSEAAEQRLLGGLLKNPAVLDELDVNLDFQDFYIEKNSTVYQAIRNLFANDMTVDLITVYEVIKDHKYFASIGAGEYLSLLDDHASAGSENIKAAARIIQEKATLRKLRKTSAWILEEAGTVAGPDFQPFLQQVEEIVFKDTNQSKRQSIYSMEDIAQEVIPQVESVKNGGRIGCAVNTPWRGVNNIIGGFFDSDLIVLAGRPGMGKTSAALTIAEWAARYNDVPVGFFSLEMSKEQLFYRLASQVGEFQSNVIRQGITESQYQSFMQASGIARSLPIFIDDNAGTSIIDIRSRARRMKKEGNIEMVVVDYLQLVSGTGRFKENRVNEVAEITGHLKAMAKELNIPVICLSQLSRESERRENKRPKLSDLRESGGIEQDADIVLFLYREGYYQEQEGREREQVDIEPTDVLISKHRHGPTGIATIGFKHKHSKFVDIDMAQRGQTYE